MTTDRIANWIARALVLGAIVLLLRGSHAGHSMMAVWPLMVALVCAVIVERETPIRTQPVPRTAEKTEEQPQPAAIDRSGTRRRVLILGAGIVGRTLAESLESSGRYEVVGFVDDEPISAENYRWTVLGARDLTTDIVAEYRVDEILLAHGPSWKEQLTQEMVARHPEVRVRVVPNSFEALLRVSRVESYGDIAVADLVTRSGRATEAAKRFFDLFTALILLVVSLPVALIVALAVKLTSRGPAIFAQSRVGRFGQEFTVFKFRTMIANAEAETGPVLANGRHDARLTKVGKLLRLTRLDEIPQLLNVLRGEMSLVGPRPERPEFARKFEQMNPVYGMRHQVRPGITGLAQICGGYHTSWRDKLRFDLIYVSHQSVWLDVTILFRTVMVCVMPRGHERKEE